MALARLMRELDEMRMDPPSLVSAGPVNRNMFEWAARLAGPVGTPYENGIFKLSIHFSRSYPNKAPRVTFVTPIYHMNINDNGGICLDLLNDNWSSKISVKQLMLALCKLLSNPNPADVLDWKKHGVYVSSPAAYNRRATEHTRKYARGT